MYQYELLDFGLFLLAGQSSKEILIDRKEGE
jgi:hypothetical protein